MRRNQRNRGAATWRRKIPKRSPKKRTSANPIHPTYYSPSFRLMSLQRVRRKVPTVEYPIISEQIPRDWEGRRNRSVIQKKRSRADDSQRSDSLKDALNNPSSSSSKKPPKRTKRKKLAQEEQGRSDEPSQTGMSAKLKSPTPSEFEKDSRTLCGTPEWIPGFESTNRNIRRYQNSPAFRRERQKEMKESLIRRHCIEPFLTQAVEASEDGNIYHAMEKVEDLLTEAYQQKLIERESAYLSDEQEEKPEEIENSRLSQCSGPVMTMTELDNTQASLTTKSMTGTDLEGSAFAMKIRARLARKNSGVDTA